MVFFILVLIYGYIIFVVEVYIVSTVVFFLGKEGGVLDGGVLGGRVQGGSIAVVVIEGVFFLSKCVCVIKLCNVCFLNDLYEFFQSYYALII